MPRRSLLGVCAVLLFVVLPGYADEVPANIEGRVFQFRVGIGRVEDEVESALGLRPEVQVSSATAPPDEFSVGSVPAAARQTHRPASAAPRR